jgi:hypothetical protein
VYISNEATAYLKQWLDWKYKNPDRERKFNQEDLVFTVSESKTKSIYNKAWYEFDRLLTIVRMDQKKEQGIHNRKKITSDSLTPHAKTFISEQAGQDYSEFYLPFKVTILDYERNKEKRNLCNKDNEIFNIPRFFPIVIHWQKY